MRVWLSALLLAGLATLPRAGAARAHPAALRTAGLHACTFDHAMLHSPRGTCRPRARHYPRSLHGGVERSIYDSALTFGIPYVVLYRIAQCESSLDPWAAYDGHYGLYQFLPATFERAARELRRDTGVIARTYWNPLDSAYAAGYLFATGESRNWACEKLAAQLPP